MRKYDLSILPGIASQLTLHYSIWLRAAVFLVSLIDTVQIVLVCASCYTQAVKFFGVFDARFRYSQST